ncbi:MAG TPA: quaternary ammonium compound efflux SMR transporter SugE [Methylophaga aminisulfidivorans]|uniref:Guanidinium exporter n=2 Tax=root TaxID=1 RepID=A0A7C1W5L5_9GAMM|nr:quaternary ammonium compound efflux SMR transporter SugE [Methylophaga aminisulfidivorans]
MAWVYLLVAGVLEVVWATGLKYSDGLTRLWPTVIAVVTVTASLYLLGLAMKSLPMGTAYTIWTGIGAVGTVVLGIVVLGESASPVRLISIALIVLGAIGLKVSH